MSTITTYYRGDMSFEAVMGEHRLLIDAPATIGGKGRGPSPPDLFVTSLGSCVAAFVAHYCETVGLDTTDLTVDVSFGQVEGEPPCPTCLVDIEVVINLPHAEVGARERAIERVAEHCPVHETVEYRLKAIAFEVRDRTKVAAGIGSG
ncbi:MAG TPA: OsmC family protein [Actinomycetota bacterium]|nr:OsmC family protein [Actinomycetota bacterium]